jgi:hypothetical protein
MKTKILLRFLVTIVILAAVVLGVWLIWFKPSNELEVFNMLTELQNDRQANHKKVLDYTSNSENENNGIKQNTGVSTSIEAVYGVDEYVKSEQYSLYYGQIGYYRAYMFAGFTGFEKDQTVNPYKNTGVEATATLENMYNAVDAAFKYYYSYVQLAEDVSNSEVNDMKDILKELNKSYDSFAKNANDVYAIIKQYSSANTVTVLSEVSSLYNNLLKDYYSIVKLYTDLTIQTKNFVVEHVFDGNIAYDAKTVYYDVVLNAVNELTEKELKVFDENGVVVATGDYLTYSTDAVKAIVKGLPDPTAVKAYANVSKNYAEGLTGEHGIFKVSRENKVKIKNNDAEAKSWYNETYFNEVQTLVSTFFGV